MKTMIAKSPKERLDLTFQDSLMLKISKVLSRFKIRTTKYTLDEAIEDYCTISSTKKTLDSIYKKTTDIFKADGRSVIRGKKNTLICKKTGFSNFDKEAFIEDYGPKIYEKYQKPSVRCEYIIVDNKTIDSQANAEE